MAFAERDQAEILVIYGHKRTDLRVDAVYGACHPVILLIVMFTAQCLINLHGSTETPAFVDIEPDQIRMIRPDLGGLLFKREEQVFFQSPVQKRADICDFFDFEDSQMSHRNERMGSRGDRTVF